MKEKLLFNNWIKIGIWICLFLACSFLLFHIRESGFVSTKEVIRDWNTKLYINTTKIVSIALIVVAISVSFSSATIQNINKNNIATSSTLGIGSAALFGMILGMYLRVDSNIYILLFMFLGSIFPILINYLILRKSKKVGNKAILVGLAITALVSIINYILRDLQSLPQSVLLGLTDLNGNPIWNKLWYVVPMMIVGIGILIFYSKRIDLINKAKIIASKSNFSLTNTYLMVSFGNLLIIIAAAYFMGQLAFLGIIATNILRYFLKTNNTLSLAFFSVIINVILLVIAQFILYKFEAPRSITILFAVAPMFIFVIWKEGGKSD